MSRRSFTVLAAAAVAFAVTLAAAAAAAPRPVWSGSAGLGTSAWDYVQDGQRNPSVGDTSITAVDAPFAPGVRAWRFRVSSLSAPGGPRAELADSYKLREGRTWWFGDVLYVPADPNRRLGWEPSNHTLIQFKQTGGGSPPLALELRADRRHRGLGTEDADGWHSLLPMSELYDRPLAIEIRVRFSADPAHGSYEVWIDDRRALVRRGVATLAPGRTSYFKQGQYGNGRGNVTYWLGARRGTSRQAVRR